MIRVGPIVPKEASRVPIKVVDAEFTLILRPVTEDERLTDQGLRDRFWNSDDPATIGRMHKARSLALLKLVDGWEGVEGIDGKPLKFSEENLRLLLAVPGVSTVVAVELIDHFNGGSERSKGEPNASANLPTGSSAADGLTKSLTSSVGTQGELIPENSQGELTSTMTS